jgi:hypothetical protein
MTNLRAHIAFLVRTGLFLMFFHVITPSRMLPLLPAELCLCRMTTRSRPQSVFAEYFRESPLAEWYPSTKSGPHVSLFLVLNFGVNTCPFNFGIKDAFISELTRNPQHLQAESALISVFRFQILRVRFQTQNPSSSNLSSSNLQMANQDQILQVSFVSLNHIRHYSFRAAF